MADILDMDDRTLNMDMMGTGRFATFGKRNMQNGHIGDDELLRLIDGVGQRCGNVIKRLAELMVSGIRTDRIPP